MSGRNYLGQEFILLPNVGDDTLRLLPSGNLEWSIDCTLENEAKLFKASTTLDRICEILTEHNVGIDDEVVARVAAHIVTTYKTEDSVTVTDFRTGKKVHQENEAIAAAAQAISLSQLSFDQFEIGYQPIPCFRHPVPSGFGAVNYLSVGWIVQAYLTLFQGEQGFERRYEFGFLMRDSIYPSLAEDIKQRAL